MFGSYKERSTDQHQSAVGQVSRMPCGSTHMSSFFMGPRLGSYSPPAVGVCVLSSRIGLVICLTDIALTSSEDRNEKEVPAMLDEMARVMSIVGSRGGRRKRGEGKEAASKVWLQLLL